MPVLDGSDDSSHPIVTLDGHDISGGVVSTISINCTQLLEFQLASVAVQVLVIVSSSGHVPGKKVSEKVIVASGSHTSVTIAEPVLEGSVGSSHSTAMSDGHVITGDVVSTTDTVVVHVDELPEASDAV